MPGLRHPRGSVGCVMDRKPGIDPFSIIWAVIGSAVIASFLYGLLLFATRT